MLSASDVKVSMVSPFLSTAVASAFVPSLATGTSTSSASVAYSTVPFETARKSIIMPLTPCFISVFTAFLSCDAVVE